MRPVLLRALWAATAVGTAAAVGVTTTQLLGPEARVVASGPVIAAATDDAVAPSDPDPSLEPVVLAAVTRAGGVDLAGGGSCPAARLTLSWTDPGPGWRSGGFVAPLGPAPTLRTSQVNGVVLCAGSHHAFVGFDAVRTAFGWDVELVPDPFGGVDAEGAGTNEPDPVPAVKRRRPPVTGWAGRATGTAIEGYARYEGQTRCDPSAKPGTLALRDLLLARYPSTTSLGISRACGVGGRSEHKEGRAFDWGTDLNDGKDRAAAEDFLRRLLATDAAGNRHALARRMGLMYVIWDHQIWSAYRADAGWRPYTGSSPHTDHVHVSLSWAGALGQTSFWSGAVVDGLSPVPVGAAGTTTVSTSTRRTAPTTGTGGDQGGTSYRDGDQQQRHRTTRRPRRDRDATQPVEWTRERDRDGDRDRVRRRDRDDDGDRDRDRDRTRRHRVRDSGHDGTERDDRRERRRDGRHSRRR